MHAVTVTVDIDPAQMDTARASLQEQVVPRVKAAPGLVEAYWLEPHPGDSGAYEGFALIVAESEEAAQAIAAMARQGQTPPGVTIGDVEVREVIAHA